MRRIVAFVVFALAWFVIAGQATWWQGWALLLALTGYTGALVHHLSEAHPELAQERMRPGAEAEPWDRRLMHAYKVMFPALLAVAALDSGRFGWSSVVPALQAVGWLLLVAAGMMIWHVMNANAYASSCARIQQDRHQTVVRDGAYRWIRHPMYLAIIVAFLGMPLALGSWWSLVPAFAIVALFVYRTYREDLMLAAGLNGYTEYSRTVRYRLLPGIW